MDEPNPKRQCIQKQPTNVVDAFLELAKGFYYMWFEATTWLNIIHAQYEFTKTLCPTSGDFKRAMRKRFTDMTMFHSGNTNGVFTWDFQGPDPITLEGKKKKRQYYCVQDPKGRPVEMPRTRGVEFMKKHPQKVRIAPSRNRRSSSDAGDNPDQTNNDPSSETSTHNPTATNPRQETLDMVNDPHVWCRSAKAKALFAPGMDNEDLRSELFLRVNLLDEAVSTASGYRNIVPNRDFENQCSEYDIWCLRSKAQVLRRAYLIALEDMGQGTEGKTFRQCCQAAVDQCCKEANRITTSAQVVMRWNRSFRKNRVFPHPNRYVALGKRPLPPALEESEELVSKIRIFCRENLQGLSIDKLWDHINKILPDIDGDSSAAIRAYKEKPPSHTTVGRWMKALGFVYGIRKKTYYVDNHENPMNQSDRREFVTTFLHLERRTHRWIQISRSKLESILRNPTDENEKKLYEFSPFDHGYAYTNEDGEEMREYHVDDNPYFMDLGNAAPNGYGGNLSVRMKPCEKPALIWGQDETVMHQNRFSHKQWATPEGEVAITQKSDGYSKMISGIQSREFGFGFSVTEEQLAKVNMQQRAGENENYKDTGAAMEVLGRVKKEALKESPFIKTINPGKNDDGYWDYQHMVLQMEDCWDVVSVLLPEFDHIFMFDASTGHRKKRDDGLDIAVMSKGFGGSQPKMHDTTILDDYHPYDHKDGSPVLEKGDTQAMVFQPTDAGPFWLSPQERDERRTTQVIPDPNGEKRDRTKQEMYDELLAKGIQLKCKFLNKFTHPELQDLCRKHDIEIQKVKEKVINGWVGQPKGMLQILWERGWIDEDRVSEYQLLSKDEDGEIDEELSLRFLLGSCRDFVEEKSRLEYIASLYDMKIWMTPKYHAEIAGCGIEYSWGALKSCYRSLPADDKKGTDGFDNCIKKAMSILTIETVRKCDRHARSYICAYYVLEVLPRQQRAGGEYAVENVVHNDDDDNKTTYAKIEKFKKAFKTHRCALDFDSRFCASFSGLSDN